MAFDPEGFVEECRRALDEGSARLAVRDVVERAVREPGAIEGALGTVDGWCMDVLHHAADLTVLHIVWPPAVDLFPHEHRMWSAIGIYGGIEDNTYYRRRDGGVEVTGHVRGEAGDVLLLGADGIHSVANPTRQWTAALHVYGGDFFATPRDRWDPTTGDAAPFDPAEVRAVLAAADAEARSRTDR